VAAVVGGINPDPDDGPRGGIAEPFIRGYPPGRGRWCLGVPAPLPGGLRPGDARSSEPREPRHRGGQLVHVLRGQDHANSPVQLIMVELPVRVVLAEQGDQPFAVGVPYPRPRTARRGTWHGSG
jgi:hypothetical protein